MGGIGQVHAEGGSRVWKSHPSGESVSVSRQNNKSGVGGKGDGRLGGGGCVGCEGASRLLGLRRNGVMMVGARSEARADRPFFFFWYLAHASE